MSIKILNAISVYQKSKLHKAWICFENNGYGIQGWETLCFILNPTVDLFYLFGPLFDIK